MAKYRKKPVVIDAFQWTADENQTAEFACIQCGHQWGGIYKVDTERICMECRSNSVRWLKKKRVKQEAESTEAMAES